MSQENLGAKKASVTSSTSYATSPITPTKPVLAYTIYNSYNYLTTNATMINEIATATYTVDGNGALTGYTPSDQIGFANTHNIKPFVMIGNNFDSAIAKTLLETPSSVQNFITNLTNILKAGNYKGANIDIENIPAADRDAYTAFIQKISSALKPLGYSITIAVPAKIADSPTRTWDYAYDYAKLAPLVDYIMLMTYDEHYPGGDAGPIASIGWVKSVLDYSITVVPKEKLYLGLPGYGYDWSTLGTKAYGMNACKNLASTYGASIIYDTVSQSPHFNYTDSGGVKHSVWFENGLSISAKLDLANQYGVKGVGLWRLGLENSEFWTSIQSKLIYCAT